MIVDMIDLGLEWQTMKGWNSYQNNAHTRDPLYARFQQQDPMADKYYPFSPYNYGAGNPLKYVDVNGAFSISNDDAQKSLKLSNYLKNGIQDIVKEPKIMNALSKYGEMTRTQIIKALEYGNGPQVKICNIENNAYGAFQPNKNSNIIEIDEDLIRSWEVAKGQNSDVLLFLTGVTILHEFVHYGDDRDGVDQKGEEGVLFEKAAYGKEINFHTATELMSKYIETSNKNERVETIDYDTSYK